MKEKQAENPRKVKWVKTRYQGVYYRVSQGEKVHRGKADKCFFIRFKKEGRRVMEKVGWGGEGYSAELAKGIRGERLRAIRHGEELPKEKAKIPRFSEMWKNYLSWAEQNKARAGADDKGRYENHLKAPLGKKRLNDISSFDLERLKSNLTKKELSPATVKHCLMLVREIFNKAREWGKYKGENPIRGVKLPTLQNRRERFLSHEEADLLLKELVGIHGKATHDQALLALHCGLRAGEIFNLRPGDLDFEHENIRIMDPKNKSARVAYMTQAVKEMLQARSQAIKGEYLFSERGSKERVKVVSQTFDRAVAKLGFNKGVEDPRQKVVFHTLRHTFGSWLAIQGTPILTIKELMGHKTLAMTERYAHLTPDVKRQATLALEADFEASRNNEKVLPLAMAKEVPAV